VLLAGIEKKGVALMGVLPVADNVTYIVLKFTSQMTTYARM